MEMQVFNSEGELYFKLNRHSFIYERLLKYFKNTVYFSMFNLMKEDFKIEYKDLLPFQLGVFNEIKNLKKQAQLSPSANVPSNFFVEETILGESLILYPLDPLHSQVIELHKIFSDVKNTVESESFLQIFTVPSFNSIQFRILKTLKNSSGALSLRQLREEIRQEYKRLLALDIVNEELKKTFEKDMIIIDDFQLLRENTAYLQTFNLLQHDAADDRITASAKLLLIKL